MSYLIYDLVILVVLILFALWGRHRGLILSVFSFVALLVAIAGGFIISNLLTPPVTAWVQPTVENAVVSAVQSTLPEDAVGVIGNISPDDIPADMDSADSFSFDALQDYLEENNLELPEQVQNFLEQMDEEAFSAFAGNTSIEKIAASAAEKITETIVHIVLFLLAFVLILILWHVLARALDLVSRLPGLNAMNKLGGVLFGALRGALFLFVCAWLLQKAQAFGPALIPGEAIAQSYLLRFFMTVNPLEFLTAL